MSIAQVAAAPLHTDEAWDDTYDLIVLGAGAGGMTAALVGAIEGLRTLLLEKSDQVGGTTAYSSGAVWIPNNPDQRRNGITDDEAAARTYLDALVGDRGDRAIREAFLAAGPRMVDYLERHSSVRLQMYTHNPDYRQEYPGAALGGRALNPVAFDGRVLGKAFDRVRAPIPELMLFGGMMVTRPEVGQLLDLRRPLRALGLGARLVTRYLLDRLRYARGTRLVLGNALAASLYKNLLERQVPIWFGANTIALIKVQERVVGVSVQHAGKTLRVRAQCGVVLAGGGFPANAELREKYLPAPVAAHTPAYEGCTGDTLVLAQQIGAALGPSGLDNALWFPSSIAQRRDGSTAVYPHIVLDRAKPGLVAVNALGLRFVDEAVSYHEFVRAMYRSHRTVPSIPAWLVCDHAFIRKYGLGMVRPRLPGLPRYIARGYLRRAETIEELARRISVDPTGLVQTIADNNAYAQSGVDSAFGKGGNAYDRGNGDATHGPNPCLGSIYTPPYYAVPVEPTPLGTSLGLRTSVDACVCAADGRAIEGLYTCGNDMHSIVGGEYPGAGAQLGAAMTFGYVAALHMAGMRERVG